MIIGTAAFWFLSLFFKTEKVSKKDMWLIFVGAICGLAGTQLAFAEALRYASPSYISLISAMGPLVVMLLAAIFLKEPISVRKVVGVLFGIAGALLIILFSFSAADANNGPIGHLLCFVNILFYAVYLLITRNVSLKYSPVTLMKWMFLFCTFICVPIGIPFIHQSPMLYGNAPTSAYFDLTFVVVLATVVAYFLVPKALHYLRPTTVSMYSNLQPIITSTVAIVLGQDVFTWNKPASLVLIAFGVYLVTTSRAKDMSSMS